MSLKILNQLISIHIWHKYNPIFLVLFCVFMTSPGHGQDIKVDLGTDELAMNQAYTITITTSNSQIKSVNGFPDIPGFLKRGTSSSSSTSIINGQVSSTNSVTQNYIPQKEGIFNIQDFTLYVNGQQINVAGKRIKVGPPLQAQQRNDPFDSDPFDRFFGRSQQSQQDFIDIKEDAFLALSVDKNEVYVGEGILTTLAFYVAESNRAPMQFHNIGTQLTEILKKIKPANSWEENFNIDNINGVAVIIDNKKYTQYKLYQGMFFPFNEEDIVIPGVGLEMIKYKIARNRSLFGQSKQEDFKTFYSQPKTIKVKPLPPHPLKDQVAVGNYRLKESINKRSLNTGESFSYNFSISGEGNISAIKSPTVADNGIFEFYPPASQVTINRKNNRVTGSKAFSYYGIPHEPGNYNLGNYFSWIFFNPQTSRYDTLSSAISVATTGDSKKNEAILSTDMGSFYDIIDDESNKLVSRNRDEMIKMFANIFILLMLVLTGIVLFKK